MPGIPHAFTLDELFESPNISLNAASLPRQQAEAPPQILKRGASMPRREPTPTADALTDERQRDVSPVPRAAATVFPKSSSGTIGLERCTDENGDGESLVYSDVRRTTADYGALSTATMSREPSRLTPSTSISSFASRSSMPDDRLSSLHHRSHGRESTRSREASAVSRSHAVPDAETARAATFDPVKLAFSDAFEHEVVTPEAGNVPYATTVELLRQFLQNFRRFTGETSEAPKQPPIVNSGASKSLSTAAAEAASSTSSLAAVSPAFRALRQANLVPSVVPCVAAQQLEEEEEEENEQRQNESTASAAGAAPPPPYLIESVYMRASTVSAVLRRQKADRHTAFNAARPPFFGTRSPLSDANAGKEASSVLASAPARLSSTFFDMPLHLRCALCKKHDSLCSRCHRRWTELQTAYRRDAATHCYSTLRDMRRRSALALLTAAAGTGAFMQMMGVVEGEQLVRRSACVTQAKLVTLLTCSGRVHAANTERVLQRAFAAVAPSSAPSLKVAHVACLFRNQDVLRWLWNRSLNGCSRAVQMSKEGWHALEWLPAPYDAPLTTVMNQSQPLRDALLWECFLQQLAEVHSTVVAAELPFQEAKEQCAALKQSTGWLGSWSEALLEYVQGDKERCVTLCKALLSAQQDNIQAEATSTAPRHSAGLSQADPILSTVNPPQEIAKNSATLEPLSGNAKPRNASSPAPATASSSELSFADVQRLRDLMELASRPEEPPPRLEAAEEEPPFPIPTHTATGRLCVNDLSRSNETTDVPFTVALRRLPFCLVRRALSYCDAVTLVHVHAATRMPLLQWVTLARVKCLAASQWTALLTSNSGYGSLMTVLCSYTAAAAAAPTPCAASRSREEREAEAEAESEPQRDEAKAAKAAESTQPQRELQPEVAALSLACSPFIPLRITMEDMDDFAHLTVRSMVLCHLSAQSAAAVSCAPSPREAESSSPLLLLRRLFGRETARVQEMRYLVLSRLDRLAASDDAWDLSNSNLSTWTQTILRSWQVDVAATVRWCKYAKVHAEAGQLFQ